MPRPALCDLFHCGIHHGADHVQSMSSMTAANRQTFLSFIWQDQYDSPSQGYHATPGDAGGGTFGGVIEDTWAGAVACGLVTGLLRNATRDQLATVLLDEFWAATCDALPPGLDLMLGNGRMMSGAYPRIFQQSLGLIDADVDGDVGKNTIAIAQYASPTTFISALHGAHYAYLRTLGSWPKFGGRRLPDGSYDGWTGRLVAARSVALGLAHATLPKQA